MCVDKQHQCYCGIVYPCELPNWICPTRNGDEDQHLCEPCLERIAEEMQAWADVMVTNADNPSTS